MPVRVNRLDRGSLGQVKDTPQGGIRVPANLTRVGIFEYKREDGTIQRELRRPSQVFDPESLRTLDGAPVTDLHPSEMVSADNFEKYAKGHVADHSSKKDGLFVSSELVVQNRDLVNKVKRKDRKEVSLGYSCVIVPTSGVVDDDLIKAEPELENWRGQKWDCEQTMIRYNHAAIGPEGWGRAGSEVAMKLDHKGNQVVESKKIRSQHMFPTLVALTFAEDFSSCRVDGVEFRLDSKDGRTQALNALNLGLKRAKEAADRFDLDPEKAKSLVDEVMATMATLQTQFMALAVACSDASMAASEPVEPAPEDIPEPVLDAYIEKRIALRERARKIKPDLKFDGLSQRDIMIECLKVRGFEIKEDHSDDFVRGLFEGLVTNVKASASTPGLHDVHENLNPKSRQDDNGKPTFKTAEEVRIDSLSKSRNAWKNPLNGK